MQLGPGPLTHHPHLNSSVGLGLRGKGGWSVQLFFHRLRERMGEKECRQDQLCCALRRGPSGPTEGNVKHSLCVYLTPSSCSMTKACLQFYTGCVQEESQRLCDNIYFTVALGSSKCRERWWFSPDLHSL